MKQALLIGVSKLFDVEEEQLLWNCRACENLFHTSIKQKSGVIECPNCHKKIEIKINEPTKEDIVGCHPCELGEI